MGFETPKFEAPTNEPSPERKRELIDAKNALKEIVENIPNAELKKMSTGDGGPTSELIDGYDGDVNRYVLQNMKAESGNDPDVAAWHVVEKLVRIKKELSE